MQAPNGDNRNSPPRLATPCLAGLCDFLRASPLRWLLIGTVTRHQYSSLPTDPDIRSVISDTTGTVAGKTRMQSNQSAWKD